MPLRMGRCASLSSVCLVLVDGGVARAQFVEPDVRVIHTFTGEAANDQFGWVTARLADLDGDGIDDMVITAPTNDAGGNNAGRIYLYGSVSGDLIDMLTGPIAGGQFGNSVQDAGLLDNDTVTDLIVGAPGTGPGLAYVYSGVDRSLIRTLRGEFNGDRFGDAVRPVDDLTGDGVNELIIGAPNFSSVQATAGRVYIYNGATFARIKVIDGFKAGGNFGSIVAGLGDVTGDGVPDIGVGAPNDGPAGQGMAYVFSGVDFSLVCQMPPSRTGRALTDLFMSSPGDVDGDGRNDVYVTDWNDAALGGGTGKAFVYSVSGTTCTLIHTFTGKAAGEGLGIGNGTAGDANFDGHDDLLIGSWVDDTGAPNAGKVSLFSGCDGMLIRTVTSTTANETLGFDAHTMGDVDGDALPDMLLSAAWNNAAGFRAGRVYLVAGESHCLADCDRSTGGGVLDVFDFLFFQSSFVAGETYACDCDTTTGAGVCDIFDFLCFQSAFVAGCP